MGLAGNILYFLVMLGPDIWISKVVFCIFLVILGRDISIHFLSE